MCVKKGVAADLWEKVGQKGTRFLRSQTIVSKIETVFDATKNDDKNETE